MVATLPCPALAPQGQSLPARPGRQNGDRLKEAMGPKVAASDSFPSCHPLVWDTQIKENCNPGQKVTREQWPQEAASESPKTDLLSFNLLKPVFPT